MSDQELEWGKPGRCPLCGVVTEHVWFDVVKAVEGDFRETMVYLVDELEGSQGELLVSRCMSGACGALALWLRAVDPLSNTERVRLVYPQADVRIPPADGLRDEEVKLYEEAACIAAVSPRAACALVRVLLEALLKRYLVGAGHSIKDKRLVDLTDLAVKNLDLSQTLKTGLTAIRKRGNTAVHDPYGLTDDTHTEDLPWLFAAVDDLVDDLHVKPKKWGGMTKEAAEDDFESATGST